MKYIKPSLKLYANHLITWFVFLVIFVPIAGVAEKKPFLFSAILAIIYIATAYGVAWRTGFMDSRRIEGYYPSAKTPAVLSGITTVVPIVLLMLVIFAPNLWRSDVPFLCGEVDFFIGGYRFNNTPDCFFRLWYLCYGAFIPNGNIFAYVLAVIVLPIIIFTGYYVGLTRFKIAEYIYAKLVFAGDSKKKEDRLRR